MGRHYRKHKKIISHYFIDLPNRYKMFYLTTGDLAYNIKCVILCGH